MSRAGGSKGGPMDARTGGTVVIDLETTDPATVAAALVTRRGTMVMTFLPDKAPHHVRHFLKLAQQGFYDGLAFHRVIRNFMIQGGCPNTCCGALPRTSVTTITSTGAPPQPPPRAPPGRRRRAGPAAPPLQQEFNDTPH